MIIYKVIYKYVVYYKIYDKLISTITLDFINYLDR